MTLTTSVGAGIAWLWGWGFASGLIFGLCLACASTVVFLSQPGQILVVVIVVMFVNFASAAAIVIANRYPLSTALSIGASLGQIGEFSIILAGLALSLSVIDSEVMNLVLAGVLLSITFNTLLFKAVEPLRR